MEQPREGDTKCEQSHYLRILLENSQILEKKQVSERRRRIAYPVRHNQSIFSNM